MSPRLTSSLLPSLPILAFLVGCGTGSASFQNDDLSGTARQISTTIRTQTARQVLWIVFIDDTPTDTGRALRDQVADELPGWIDRFRSESCVEADDASVFMPSDLDVLLVPTSDPRQAIHSGIDPTLRLRVPNATSEAGADWEASVADAILTLEADGSLPNLVFESAEYWDGVLSGRLPPERTVDAEFLSTLDSGTEVGVYVAASRDDESKVDLGSLSFGATRPPEWRVLLNPGPTCSQDDRSDFPRLSPTPESTLLCDRELFGYGLACDFGVDCIHRRPVRSDSGEVACRVLAHTDPELDCPEESGWLDPRDSDGVRTPMVEVDTEDSAKEYRVCEVRQLKGEALASCAESLECEDCEPGWCWREPFDSLDWDWRAQHCASSGGWDWSQVRLVHGAGSAGPGELVLQCDLEEAE